MILISELVWTATYMYVCC